MIECKFCRCCGRYQTLADAYRNRVRTKAQPWANYDFVTLWYFDCKCGSTLCLELFAPKIIQPEEPIHAQCA